MSENQATIYRDERNRVILLEQGATVGSLPQMSGE